MTLHTLLLLTCIGALAAGCGDHSFTVYDDDDLEVPTVNPYADLVTVALPTTGADRPVDAVVGPWAISAGGMSGDEAWAVTTDAAGNIYVSGRLGGFSIFHDVGVLTKLSPAGKVLWTRMLGRYCADVAVDSAGGIFATGGFNGTRSFGAFKLTAATFDDTYVVHLDGEGKVQWAKRLPGNPVRLAVDGEGNVHVAGYIKKAVKATFGGTPYEDEETHGVVVTLDAAGVQRWSVEGTGFSFSGIATDDLGRTSVVGQFTDEMSFAGRAAAAKGWQMFVARLDPLGTPIWLSHSERAKGDGDGYCDAVGAAVDSAGNTFVAGTFTHSVRFAPLVRKAKNTNSHADLYVAKLDRRGAFQWVTHTGGGGSYGASALALDRAGAIYLTGVYSGTPQAPALFGPTKLLGANDIFVAKLDSAGTFLGAEAARGAGTNISTGIVAHGDGFVVVGHFGIFPGLAVQLGQTTLVSKGLYDIFVWRQGWR